MNDDPTCRHESAHAVIARTLGMTVTIATVAESDPHVRVKDPFGGKGMASRLIGAFRRQAIVALAGEVVEQESEAAMETDLANALDYSLRVVLLEDALGDNAVAGASIGQHARAEELVNQSREKAAVLVVANKVAIERVASALAERGELNQAEIDAAIAAT